jgi:hypothetical protein
MDSAVREMTVHDRTAFAPLRAQPWPEESAEQHLAWIDWLLRKGDGWVFVAAAGGALVGFAKVADPQICEWLRVRAGAVSGTDLG